MRDKDFSLTQVSPNLVLDGPINELRFRQAMGLKSSVYNSLIHKQQELFDQYRRSHPEALAKAVEDTHLPFFERWVCSQLLALLGDPRVDSFNPQMLYVEGGAVTLGLSINEVDSVVNQFADYGVLREWIEKETPTYQVKLASFLLAKYCVTNHEYHEFLLETGFKELPSSWRFGIYPPEASNHPVYSLSPHSAEAYIHWLNERTGRQFRLPTEAEWEYAASGLERREFPWGNNYLADRANTVESGIINSTAVGLFPLGNGPFGHADLAGNVEEYVADNYCPYPGGFWVKDDLMSKAREYRVARGGSFTRFRDLARTRRRHGNYGTELYVMGFRLAESLANKK